MIDGQSLPTGHPASQGTTQKETNRNGVFSMRERESRFDSLLREAARLAVEEELWLLDREVKLHPHTFRPEFHKKMRRLLKGHALSDRHPGAGHIFQNSSQDNSFLRQLRARRPKAGSFRLRRRYLAVAALLMVFASVAALASETVRNGLAQLRLQFFPDNVTIEATPEPATEQGANGQTGPTAIKEFHAYKWKEVPEGYYVTFEEENTEFGYYIIEFGNSSGDFIHYRQNFTESFTTSITYDDQDGYHREINLDGLLAQSISDGRRNTIFYEKDGYFFRFMSNQPEKVIINYINMSGILDYEYENN